MTFSRSALAAAALALLVAAGDAAAHAKAVSLSPAADATVASPGAVSIAFNETLEPAFSTLTVLDAASKPVTTARAEPVPGDGKRLRIALPALPAGLYRVKWVAVAADGHRTQGEYRFRVK